MNRGKLLIRLSLGNLHNVAFGDIKDLVEGFGFRLVRVRGSHHIFKHPGVPETVNLQEVAGEAKPDQIRKFLHLIEKYNLKVEEEK